MSLIQITIQKPPYSAIVDHSETRVGQQKSKPTMMLVDVILADLGQFVLNEVRDSHGDKVARDSAKALVKCLWLNYCRSIMYVPTIDRQAISKRNEAIYAECTGRNYQDLSIKYRISLQQIYSIIKAQRAIHKHGQQNDAKQTVISVIEELLPPELVRLGFSESDAASLASSIANHLCQHFPGVSCRVTDDAWKKWCLQSGAA